MSAFYHVRCAGDGSWLSKLSKGATGDQFSFELDKALALKKSEWAKRGYPSAVYSLVPTEADVPTLMERAVLIIMRAPGGHQDVSDSLYSAIAKLRPAIKEASDALGGESNDAEHDALVSLMEALGQDLEDEDK